MLGRVAAQRMLCARIILRGVIVLGVSLRRRFLPSGTLHPGWRTGGRPVIGLCGRLIGFTRGAARLHRLIGTAPDIGKRIGLTDQPRQFGERIALGSSRPMLIVAAIVVVVRGIGSVLVSISHRDDASPFGKAAKSLLQTNQPLPDALTDPRVRAKPHSIASRLELGRRERLNQMPEPRRRPG